ncbi:MAG: aminotransferase class III-fold pyridoxal phosphate-dependent enzyme, partial [Planctomycetota bacterium]|nr:aminotransferase class III-fold pyridoxal phosphate-dependent enzyme [Planctomycetota bacterium]
MNTREIQDLFSQYVIGNYRRLPCAIVRGQGSWVWDAEGKKYLDLFPGWGVAGLGHCHPRVVAAIREQAGKLLHIANNYYTEEQGLFAQALALRAPGYRVFFANSGAEANEAALKLARLYSQPRYKIIAFHGSFHGRTFAAIT